MPEQKKFRYFIAAILRFLRGPPPMPETTTHSKPIQFVMNYITHIDDRVDGRTNEVILSAYRNGVLIHYATITRDEAILISDRLNRAIFESASFDK